jgi:hypothetical protein
MKVVHKCTETTSHQCFISYQARSVLQPTYRRYLVHDYAAHGARVASDDPTSVPADCTFSAGRSFPQHHPPTQSPWITTRFPATSPKNIFCRPPCGFFQLGICEIEYSKGECSENAAPVLKSVIRCRERVNMSVIGPDGCWAFCSTWGGVVSPSECQKCAVLVSIGRHTY